MTDTDSSSTTNTPKKGKKAWIFGLIMPLTFLLPLWFFFLGPKLRHDQLMKKGIQVPGRLLAVEETGTVVNDSPELELTVEFTRKDGVLDTSQTDFVPSRRSIHLFQEGAGVMAVYDPEDPEEITISALSTAPAQAPSAMMSADPRVDSLLRVADSLRRFADSVLRNVQGK